MRTQIETKKLVPGLNSDRFTRYTLGSRTL